MIGQNLFFYRFYKQSKKIHILFEINVTNNITYSNKNITFVTYFKSYKLFNLNEYWQITYYQIAQNWGRTTNKYLLWISNTILTKNNIEMSIFLNMHQR